MLTSLLLLLMISALPASAQAAPLCSTEWTQRIEQRVPTGDGQGHGPDAGSAEWQSVVEFRLGIRGRPGTPERGTRAWCEHIDGLVRQGPSFSCRQIPPGSTEALICEDAGLAALDRQLAGVYRQALAKAVNEQPPLLRAEQRGWIKGRNECWKHDNHRACVQQQYRRRTAELQARYRLVPERGPVRFACDGNPANEVVITHFDTVPPTLMAERGDSVSLMYAERSASGTHYRGRNEEFREHQGEATIRWGDDAPEMRCERVE